ncbi:CopD family protein [Terrihabitans rhizophilus]|uniref:Protoporphyrinogen IX oxidase n=1 Tax=Terrihabitans rhizophilus TaxID=3092662 RepID=A0ABU4RM29_9HYPH|nr:CopD family protein [Terrihabitans sp. PJ23]MDX6805879.1 CopD family protein [Terrihabitans sp. PJ23]
MSVWLKAAHICALVIWCGGLLVLPSLFALRGNHPAGPDLWRLQRFVRFSYTYVVSPAAFAAIGTGTALIFVQEVFTPWFALKLLVVGLLALLHVRHGFVIVRVFEDDNGYSLTRNVVATCLTMAVVSAILLIVLAKPALDLNALPAVMHQPGALQSLFETMIPIP